MNKSLEIKNAPKVLTRIYIQEDGNLVVTDLWEDILELIGDVNSSMEESDEVG